MKKVTEREINKRNFTLFSTCLDLDMFKYSCFIIIQVITYFINETMINTIMSIVNLVFGHSYFFTVFYEK